MHKMIHCNPKIIGKRFTIALLLANIPTAASLVTLLTISQLILKNTDAPDELYRIFFLVVYITLLYSFLITLVISHRASRQINGHKKYSYMEIFREQMIVSEYVCTIREYGELCDYCRIHLINLADVEQVMCNGKKIVIKAKARKIEQKADWLRYECDDMGMVSFDYWYYNTDGGEIIQSVEFRDDYTYAERYAQRIIYCSELQKKRVIRREEFRRRMMEAAGKRKDRKKKKERVFRGYEIERKFY